VKYLSDVVEEYTPAETPEYVELYILADLVEEYEMEHRAYIVLRPAT
jgi:hypothetical protein